MCTTKLEYRLTLHPQLVSKMARKSSSHAMGPVIDAITSEIARLRRNKFILLKAATLWPIFLSVLFMNNTSDRLPMKPTMQITVMIEQIVVLAAKLTGMKRYSLSSVAFNTDEFTPRPGVEFAFARAMTKLRTDSLQVKRIFPMATNSYWERALGICFLTVRGSKLRLIERREPEGIGLRELRSWRFE